MKRPRDLALDLSGAKVLTVNLAALAQAEPPAPLRPGHYVFEIPNHRPATKNELYKTGNKFTAARLKRIDRELVALYAARAGVPPATLKRRVSVLLILAGRMKQVDPDAILWSLLDAMVQARVIVDDSPDWVELGEMRQIGGDAKSTRVYIEDIS